MNINSDPAGRQPPGVLARLVAAVAGLVVIVAALMFSVVIVAGLAVAGLLLWAYFWWKTRAVREQIRRQMREQAQAQPEDRPAADRGAAPGGAIIEGEAVRVVDERKQLGE